MSPARDRVDPVGKIAMRLEFAEANDANIGHDPAQCGGDLERVCMAGDVVVLHYRDALLAREPTAQLRCPLPSPPELVVATKPRAAAVSASFSPAAITTQASGGASSSSGSR